MVTGELAGARSDRIKYKGAYLPAGCQVRPADYGAVRAKGQPKPPGEIWRRRTLFEKKCGPELDAAWDKFFRDRTGIAYDERGIINLMRDHAPEDNGDWYCSAWILDGLETLLQVASICLPIRQCPPDVLGAIISATGWLITEDEQA